MSEVCVLVGRGDACAGCAFWWADGMHERRVRFGGQTGCMRGVCVLVGRGDACAGCAFWWADGMHARGVRFGGQRGCMRRVKRRRKLRGSRPRPKHQLVAHRFACMRGGRMRRGVARGRVGECGEGEGRRVRGGTRRGEEGVWEANVEVVGSGKDSKTVTKTGTVQGVSAQASTNCIRLSGSMMRTHLPQCIGMPIVHHVEAAIHVHPHWALLCARERSSSGRE
eukprot:349622-Chlamydomonas_euryale.AAC.1